MINADGYKCLVQLKGVKLNYYIFPIGTTQKLFQTKFEITNIFTTFDFLKKYKMILKKHIYIIALAITLNSCNLFKKSSNATDTDMAVVNLDTVETIAKTPEPQKYQ